MIAPTHEEIQHSVEIGIEATLEELSIQFIQGTEYISEWADKDPQVMRPVSDAEYVGWFWAHKRRVEMFYQWWLQSIIHSPISMQERMVLFWHNHFATDIRLGIEFAIHLYTQYRLLQKMCLGNYKQFVKEITRSIATQYCLTLHNNFVHENKKYINENYARELLELYTCGVFDENGNKNYTQNDVYEAARALTGWFSCDSELGIGYIGRYSRFIKTRWDDGEKTFLGQKGNWGTDDIIDIVFEQRSQQIASNICTKLCQYYITDNPDEDFIKKLKVVFIENNWEILPVIKTMLSSEYFFHEDNRGVLKKSHIEYVTGMIRQFDLKNIPDFDKKQDKSGDITIRLEQWGQLMYMPPNVSGWVGGRDWVNSSVLPRRLAFAQDIVHNRLLTISYPRPPAIYTFDIRKFTERFTSSKQPKELCKELAAYLLPDILDEEQTNMLIGAILDGGAEYEWDFENENHRVFDRIANCLDIIVSHAAFQLF